MEGEVEQLAQVRGCQRGCRGHGGGCGRQWGLPPDVVAGVPTLICPATTAAPTSHQTRERSDYGGRISLLESRWRQAADVIAEQEFNLLCTQEERVRLSPRAVEQGWAEQLDSDVRNHRLAVTDSKAEALFQVRRRRRRRRRTR
jgi:hypothetical protein